MTSRVNIGIELTIRATKSQKDAFSRHCGARRFAYNWCVANNRKLLEAKKTGGTIKVPVSPFDQINAFNKWKLSAEAGVDAVGKSGLHWRREVCQQVFEEGAKDFGKALQSALTNFSDRRAKRTSRKIGFPEFHGRLTSKPTFRLRNTDGKRFTVGPKTVKVPVLGYVRLREGTKSLRKLLRKPEHGEEGRITHVTISYSDTYWRLSVNLDVAASIVAPEKSLEARKQKVHAIGCDVGIHTLVTVADAQGQSLGKYLQPTEVACKQQSISKLQRRSAIKREASRERAKQAQKKERVIGNSEHRLRRKLQRRDLRQREVRKDHLHKLTRRLISQGQVFGLEDLNIAGMLRNHCLAASIARQAWGEFSRQMTYKAAWGQKTLVCVNRYFPSTKRCSRCLEVKSAVPLEVRTFLCDACGHRQDRDVNAAASLAQYAEQIANASPEVRGQDQTPELEQLEQTVMVSRGFSPRSKTSAARSRDGTPSRSLHLQRDGEARKGGVDIVNAP